MPGDIHGSLPEVPALAIARGPMERISAAPAVNPLSQEPHRAANSASTSVRQRALLDGCFYEGVCQAPLN